MGEHTKPQDAVITINSVEEIQVELNAQNLQTVGRFFDKSEIPVTDRALIYVIDDIHYRIDDDGCWYFSDDPQEMGWTKCDPPTVLRGML